MAGAALAAMHLASDDRAAARETLAVVVGRLSAIAATIPSVSHRRRYWARPLPNAGVVALARGLEIRGPSEWSD
jgi:hypothetical protein